MSVRHVCGGLGEGGFLVSVDDGTDLSRVKRENDDRSRSTASSVAGTGSFRRTWEAQVLIVIVLVVVWVQMVLSLGLLRCRRSS